MGKLKSRLAQVMPHVWFYKLKEKGKPGSHGAHKKLSSQHKLVAVRSTVATKGGRTIYTSPVNHKASDIHFPETPTRKTSPLIQGVKAEQEEGSSTGFIDMSPYGDSIRAVGFADDAAPCNSSSEPKRAYEKRRFHLDVRELERRLKALSSEDRRKYYKSPMFSVALPSPNIHNDSTQPLHDGASHSLLYDSVNFLLGNVANNHGGNPYLSDGAFSQDSGDLGFFSLNTSFGENDSNAAIGIFEESKSLEGSRSCSTSFRKSTSSSSSDTGFERASSSLWERDLSSLTSEGSDQHLFTHIEDSDHAWLHHRSSSAKSRHKKKRYKDKKAHSMSVLMSFKEGYEGCRIDNGFLNRQDGMCKCKECSKRGLLLSKQSAIEEETNSRGSRLSSADNWQPHEAASQKPSSRSLIKYEDCSLPMPKGAMDGHKGHRRVSSNEFSHFESREIRCLEQPSDSAHSESELETLSKNYRRFKQLQQTGHLRVKTMPKLQAKDDPLLSSNSKVKEGMGMINLSLPRTSGRTKPHDNPCLTYPKSSGPSNDDQRHTNRHMSEQAYEDPILFPTSRFKEELGGMLSPSLSRSKSCGNHHHSGRLGSEEPWTSDDNQANTEEGSNRDTGRGHEGKRSAGKDSKVLDSFAIVKCSYDPKKDFKESMMDMIVEKELRSSVELVELLQCYLSLNSERYHGTIVRVFSEVWSELFH